MIPFTIKREAHSDVSVTQRLELAVIIYSCFNLGIVNSGFNRICILAKASTLFREAESEANSCRKHVKNALIGYETRINLCFIS